MVFTAVAIALAQIRLDRPLDAISLVTLIAFGTVCLLVVLINRLNHLAYLSPRTVARVRWLFDPRPRAHLEYALGDPGEGLRQLARERSNGSWPQIEALNTRVALLTACGLYREAVAARPTRTPWPKLRKAVPFTRGLVLLNKAEALYNLGRWGRAERLMIALAGSGTFVGAWIQVGAMCQLAWILAHTGRAAEASFLLRGVQPAEMSRPYRAEVFFTLALIAIELGELDDAARALDQARQVLVRESSRRNLCFLEARLHEVRGNLEAAYSSYETASAMTFKGQGGPELRRWARVATRLGRLGDAASIERLARERDPQSPVDEVSSAQSASGAA